jgi:hypothetical protein
VATAIIDAQSINSAGTVRPRQAWVRRGQESSMIARRHIVLDTIGLLVIVLVSAANVQDRDGARPRLRRCARRLSRSA